HELTECQVLATSLHRELSLVIPAFVRRALDDRYGRPAAERMVRVRELVAKLSPSPLAGKGRGGGSEPSVRLVEFDPDAERKVVAAALFPHSDQPLEEGAGDPAAVLDALLADRANRRQRAPRALEHATYTFEIVANFGAYRELHPRLAAYARFVDLGPGDELERRQSERRIDEKLDALDRRVR